MAAVVASGAESETIAQKTNVSKASKAAMTYDLMELSITSATKGGRGLRSGRPGCGPSEAGRCGLRLPRLAELVAGESRVIESCAPMPLDLRPIPSELDFPDDDKPYVESIAGTPVRKLSPKLAHAVLQWRIAAQIGAWAAGRGYVGTEWRFYLLPPEGTGRASSLVPDVAFVARGRLPDAPTDDATEDARERPRLAPDLAVEILSLGDRTSVLKSKIELYLAHGTKVVMVVDPGARTIVLHTPSGQRKMQAEGRVTIELFENLELDADLLFEGLARSKR